MFRVASCALPVVLAVVLAVPVLAHPFGPPPTALVSARGRSVFVEWESAPDDAVAIGEHLGLLAPGSVDAFREGATQVAPPREAIGVFSQSPQLRAYLLDHISVRQQGVPCDGTVQQIGDFVQDGARVVYECPAAIDDVELRITMLHHLNDAYRTFAVSDGSGQPRQAAFTVAEPTHEWTFAEPQAGDTPERNGGPPLAGLLVPVGLLAFGGLVVGLITLARRGGS